MESMTSNIWKVEGRKRKGKKQIYFLSRYKDEVMSAINEKNKEKEKNILSARISKELRDVY
jgi:NCAIR mutase (PurE)-related protein